jgi:4-hydroxy-3-methylbut-2-en-1-yl diphosphate synthase IspG/GcpE
VYSYFVKKETHILKNYVDGLILTSQFFWDYYYTFKYHKDFTEGLTLAVMGCPVNGPGEAREADLGLACGKKTGLLFKEGKVIKKVKEEEMINTLIQEIKKIRSE